MPTLERRRVPAPLWPFHALWRLLTYILGVTGRVLAAVIGLVLMMVGLLVSVTVVGAPVGIPLVVLGFLLLLRSVF